MLLGSWKKAFPWQHVSSQNRKILENTGKQLAFKIGFRKKRINKICQEREGFSLKCTQRLDLYIYAVAIKSALPAAKLGMECMWNASYRNSENKWREKFGNAEKRLSLLGPKLT